jgi:hypothetical protein
MTRFGKILVLLNLTLSLMLAAWAFNVYANSIDWSDKKDKGIPVGMFAIHGARLEEAWKGVVPAQSSWQRQRGRLGNVQMRLLQERAWYDQELRHIYVGKSKDKPIGQVAIAAKDDDNTGIKRGQILLDDQGFPKMEPILDLAGKPLQLKSLAEYNQDQDKLLNELAEVMRTHEKQIDEANRLTDLIIGDKDKGLRGLQQRINDEKDKDAEVLAERKLVEPLLINTVVEAQLINKRHQQLEKRIEELRKWKVASK